jgi:glycosyltransferase involved in cell wall biosynthesis
MRPLVLISGLGPGGAEHVTVALLRHLQRAGFPAIACTVTNRHDGPLAAELRTAGVDRRDLGARRLADGRAVLRLARMFATEKIDVVHAHGQDAAIIARYAASLRRTPLVITRHVMDEPRDSWRLRVRATLALKAFRAADIAVAVSSATADALARLGALPRESIRVVHNGIDVESFARPDPHQSRSALERSLRLDPADQLVLLPGIMRPGKGHDDLLDALPLLLQRVPGARVLFAGDGPEQARLRQRATSFGERVRFLGHRGDMPALMAASDLVVLPSRSEGLPTVLMEAAAAGRPVVASAVGGVSEVVEPNGSGILVPPGEPTTLALAMETVLANETVSRRLGQRARRIARERFTLRHQVDATLALWSEAQHEATR